MDYLLQYGDFPQTCYGKSFGVSTLNFDLLQGVKPSILLIPGLVDDAIRTHSDPLQLSEVNHTPCIANELLSLH